MSDLRALFPDVRPEHIFAAEGRFLQMDRQPGDVVVEEGDQHDAMFLIESGTVKVTAGGFDVAELGAGACVGEIGLFTTSVRTATVTAVTPVTFRLLSRPAFKALEAAGNPVARHIERRAIAQLGARLRRLVSDIRIVAPHAHALLLDPVQTRQTEGLKVPFPRPGIEGALRMMASFDPELSAGFEPLSRLGSLRVYQPGETLAAVGRRDGPLLLLVGGKVDCLVTLEVEQVRAATLSGGELFNVLPFVDRQPRPMTFVAAGLCSVLAFDKAGVVSLMKDSGPVASAIRGAMIRSLADRVNQANATFSLAKLTRLEVDSSTPMAPPARTVRLPPETPRPMVRASPARRGPAVTTSPAAAADTPAYAPPEPVVRAPAEPPMLEPPPVTPDEIDTDKKPPAEESYDPREFVTPAPLSLGKAAGLEGDPEEGPPPWFGKSDDNDWDTWFDLTDEESR